MLFFKISPFYHNGLVSCYLAYLLITLSWGIACGTSNEEAPNYGSGSTGSQTTSYQSASAAAKSVAASIASLSSAASLQTSINPVIQRYAISDLTRDLSLQLKSIESSELLVPAIQSAFDSLERVPSSIDHNDTKILNSIATKIETKFTSALRILNETNHKFLNILTENIDQSRKLLLDPMILPCSSTPKHAERSAYDRSNESNQSEFIGGINKKKAIEVLNFLKNAGHLHETDDKNFTINKRLMETLKNIDLSSANVPNFRDVFFLPRDNQISSTNCRNTVPNEHHRYNEANFVLLTHIEKKNDSNRIFVIRFLYASSVISKKIILIVDIGSMTTNSDSLDVTKSFGMQTICV